MKKLISSILFLAFALPSFGSEYALRIFDKTNEVLEQKETALNLEQVKELAAGENVDVQIAYERLYQAQSKIALARANFFPYGLGDVGIIYFTNSFTNLILVELVTSIPSKWFAVASARHQRNAESWSLKALRENIRNQSALLYYNILKEESMLKLARFELNLMEELLQARTTEAEVGVRSAEELSSLRFRILNLRDEYLKFEGYLAEEKTAMKILLNMPYYENLELQPEASFLSAEDYNLNTESLALMAQQRSYEVKAAEQTVYAAYDSRRSAQWSILSFSGIGFGYLSNVRMERSRARDAELRLEAVRTTVYNNAYTRKSMLENSVDFFLAEKNISDTTESFVRGQLAEFSNGTLPVGELIESELYYLRDFRNMLRAHYNSLVRLDDLERIVLGNISTSELVSRDDFSITAEYVGSRIHFKFTDPNNRMGEVESATYSFLNQRQAPIKSFRKSENFSARVRARRINFPAQIEIKVVMHSGEVLKKRITVTE
ncbi:MAG: hypothetical protein CME65_07430 [Halobacteriovoraceae bacterium]|nr:hypothetical protein [Halobacteriovoraceae bacterium]|tara:strand:+ start:7714 stop:9192 length:1479 start_codon:yes stop_codon:yes gene_type:complete